MELRSTSLSVGSQREREARRGEREAREGFLTVEDLDESRIVERDRGLGVAEEVLLSSPQPAPLSSHPHTIPSLPTPAVSTPPFSTPGQPQPPQDELERRALVSSLRALAQSLTSPALGAAGASLLPTPAPRTSAEVLNEEREILRLISLYLSRHSDGVQRVDVRQLQSLADMLVNQEVVRGIDQGVEEKEEEVEEVEEEVGYRTPTKAVSSLSSPPLTTSSHTSNHQHQNHQVSVCYCGGH